MPNTKFLYQFCVKRLPCVVIALFVMSMPGCMAGLSSSQKAMVKNLHVSDHKLPHHATRVVLSPKGILEVDSAKSQGAYEKGDGSRTFIDVESGKEIWSGSLRSGQLLSDTPSPILVETEERKHTVVRYDRSGTILWRKELDGIFVLGLAQEEQGLILTLSLKQSKDDSLRAELYGITIADGKVKWNNQLEKISMGDNEIGSLWHTQKRLVFSHNKKVFLLLANKAMCIAVSDGRLLFNREIPTGSTSSLDSKSIWLPLSDDVIVVTGEHVLRLSENRKRHLYANIGAKSVATDALLNGNDVVIAFTGEDKRGVAALDAKTAKWRWQSSAKASNRPHPQGIAVTGESVMVASDRHLLSYSMEKGKTIFSEKIPGEFSTLVNSNDKIVLIGPYSIEGRSANDGGLLWRKDGFKTPLDWYYGQRAASMLIVQTSLQASANISASQARWYSSQANRQLGGYYVHNSWARYQYAKLGHIAGRSAAVSNLGASMAGATSSSAGLIDRMVSVIVNMQPSESPLDHAYFLVTAQPRALTGQTRAAKLSVVNLADGSTHEIPVREAPLTCIPAVMVNERLGLIVQAYHHFPFCTGSRTIDILRLPTASELEVSH